MGEYFASRISFPKKIFLQYLLHLLMFKIHKQQKDFTEIHRLDFGNNFKWQADDSDHHMVCVEGKFRCNLVFHGLAPSHLAADVWSDSDGL